jgi:hypothetical protein
MTARFQALSRKQKWSGDFYREELERTVEERVNELAQRPDIPGLNSEVKN